MLTVWLGGPVWPFARARSKTIDLRFSPASLDQGVRTPQFHTSKFQQEFAELAEAPLDQLVFLRREAKGLNRASLGPRDRLQRIRQGLVLFYPLLQQVLRMYSREGGIPDSHRRRETLDQCAEILQIFSQAYMLVFKHHYERPDAQFNRAIVEVRICACRVLEMLRLEQRVRALRYQPLRPDAWVMANTLFHVMRAYDDVNAAVPLLEGELLAAHAGRSISLHDLFASLQLTGRLDMLRWPVAFQALLVGYLDSLVNLVQVGNFHGAELRTEQLLIHCHEDRPAGVLRGQQPGLPPPILFDWSALAARVRTDCTTLFKACCSGQLAQVPKRLRLLSIIESLSLAQLLLTSMRRVEPLDSTTEQASELSGMKFTVGFQEAYQLSSRILWKRAEDQHRIDPGDGIPLLKYEDLTSSYRSQWYLLHQSPRQLRLRTVESEFTTAAMSIGDLVAYALSKDDWQRPRFAAVRRIYRPQSGQVIIDLERLAKYAEPVTLIPVDQTRFSDEIIHGLLTFDPDQGCNLLISPTANVFNQTMVRMVFRERSYELELGSLKYVASGFYLFRMPLRMSLLGLDAPPAYAEASVALQARAAA